MSRMLKSNGHFRISTYGTCIDLATTTLVEPGMFYFEKISILLVFVPPTPLCRPESFAYGHSFSDTLIISK